MKMTLIKKLFSLVENLQCYLLVSETLTFRLGLNHQDERGAVLCL